MSAALGAAWGAVVLAGLARWRPPPRRLRPPPVRRAVGRPSCADAMAGAVGRMVLRKAGPERARRAGRIVLGTAAALALAPPLAPVPLLAGWGLPRLATRRDRRARERQLEASLPEAVDLLALAVGAGCNVSLAVEAAGRRGTGAAAAELARVAAEVRDGRRLADALDALPARAGEAARPLAAALSACERYGAPLVPTLERLGDEVRRQRQRRAEEAARRVPVLLVFPLVLCILPAFALLTVAPLVAGALGQLRL